MVGELAVLAGTGRSVAEDVFAERGEEGLSAGEGGFVAADHDDEAGFAGADVAARDRGVEGVEAAGLGGGGDAAGERRARSRHVDQEGAGAGAGDDAGGPQVGGFDVGGIANDANDNIGGGGGGTGRVVPMGTGGEEDAGFFHGAVMDVEGVTGALEMAGHAAAHDAGANEGNGGKRIGSGHGGGLRSGRRRGKEGGRK